MDSKLFAQSESSRDITVIITSESVSGFIQELLPYDIDFGKKISGSFKVQSIENLKIVKDKVTFSSHIVGENVAYSMQILSKPIKVAVGNVNMRNNWETLLRHDDKKEILFLKPQVETVENEKDANQGEKLLHTLLKGLSGIEYPLKLSETKPIKITLNNRDILINTDVTGVQAEEGRLIVTMRPSAKYEEKKEENTPGAAN